MLSNRVILLCLMIVVVGLGGGENTSCTPNKFIVLSNCSFRYTHSNNDSSHYSNETAIDDRLLSMIVPYAWNQNEEDDLLITIITRSLARKPLIRLNLNLVHCAQHPREFNWTSLESSSTLTGEFVRTTFIDRNIMYLSSGVTYLRNLTALDCSTRTVYRTDEREFFQLDLRLESTLNDSCVDDSSCYPTETYQCDHDRHRCTCRPPFQSHLVKEQYPICIQAVEHSDQCTTKHVRCYEWCHENSSSTMCICPKEFSSKQVSADDRGRRERTHSFERTL